MGNTCITYFWQIHKIWKSKIAVLPMLPVLTYTMFNTTILDGFVKRFYVKIKPFFGVV